MNKLTEFERELLESMAGLRTHHANGHEIVWGAWMSACLESLEGAGLVTATPQARGHTYNLTSAGRLAISGKADSEVTQTTKL